MSDQRSNNGWKFGVGILAGAALGYWLNSEHGKKVRRDTSEQISNYSHQATEFTKEKVSQAQSNLSSAIEKGQQMLNDLTSYAKNAISRTADSAENAVDRAESRLESGMKKAKDKIDQKSSGVEARVN